MRSFKGLAASAAWVAALSVSPAHASDHAGHRLRHIHAPLPPISGTIHLMSRPLEGEQTNRLPPSPLLQERSTLGTGIDGRSYASGRFGQYRYGFDEDQSALPSRRRGLSVDSDGSAAVGGVVTGWGTADSATTGGIYPPPSPHHHAEATVRVVYGEPNEWSHGGGFEYGYPPMGGLSYYNSGSPGRMAYYGSSSSAGPYGTPGGLGLYSSGSYGPGPEIIHVSGRHFSRGRAIEGCACGPHIVELGHRRRHEANR